MKKLKFYAAVFVVALLGGLALSPMQPVGALDNPLGDICAKDPDTPACKKSTDADAGGLIKKIVNIMLYIIGALSVVMIIAGGIMYTASAGNSSMVTKAKNTLMYAIIGLIIAFFAYAIVNWVMDLF